MKRLLYLLLIINTSIFAIQTPEKAFEDYSTHLKKLDFDGASTYMHTNELLKFKKMMLPIFLSLSEEQQKKFFHSFSHFNNTSDITKQSPREFFVNFLKSMEKIKPGFYKTLKNTNQKIIGSYYDDKTQNYYVIYNSYHGNYKGMQGIDFSKVVVQPMKKEREDYKLILTGEIKGIANRLKLALATQLLVQ